MEDTLSSLQSPYRSRGATVASATPTNELMPRREMYVGESPPSFLATPPGRTSDGGTYLSSSANQGRTSPLGRMRREQNSDILLNTKRRSPKARRRMQSSDALLGGGIHSPPLSLQETEDCFSEEDGMSLEKSTTLPRRHKKTAEAMLGLLEPHSQGLRKASSQERLPSDGAPSDDTLVKRDATSPVHRSQARATLVVVQPPARPAAQGASNGDSRQVSTGSGDADSGFAAPSTHLSPVGNDIRAPTYQSTPMRPKHDVRSSSEEEALTNASSGVDLIVSNSSSNRSIADKGRVQSPTSPNKTTNETSMDVSGWFEYGTV